MKEYTPSLTKVSLRSKNDIDVSEISKKFEGGGHAKAAGFQINGSLKESEAILVKELEGYLNK